MRFSRLVMVFYSDIYQTGLKIIKIFIDHYFNNFALRLNMVLKSLKILKNEKSKYFNK
jgi:hypothetical protein